MAASLSDADLEELSVRERLDLIEKIWNSLPRQLDPTEVPEWHLAVLAERRAAAAANPQAGRPWREVLAERGCSE